MEVSSSLHCLPKPVWVTAGVYAAATSLHFLHNAVCLDAYPNLPGWFTPLGIVAALLTVHAVGLLGFGFAYRGRTTLNLLLIAGYAVLGFDGLAHYQVAAFSSHTLAMNATILLEVATALALFVAVGVALLKRQTPG